MKRTLILCDICESEDDIHRDKDMQIAFLQLLPERYSSWNTPCLIIEKMDICQNCLNLVFEGNGIKWVGCRQLGEYEFINEAIQKQAKFIIQKDD